MPVNLSRYACLSFLMLSAAVQAGITNNNTYQHVFYFGLDAGYGSTTWRGLVPSTQKQSAAITMSTPINAHEGGATAGAFMGVEIIPFFAVEASYRRYPNATVIFDKDSLFTFDHDGQTELLTHTESASLMGKFIIPIPDTSIRAFSSAGIAETHRYDKIYDDWKTGPTFSVGLDYNLTEHFMGEIVANYTGGYGESELNPADDFVPFLYSVTMRIAYRI